MRVRTTRTGETEITYAEGDYVLLTRDERDLHPTAFRGEWGKVIRVNGQALDILFAGHGRQKGVSLERVLGFPAYDVVLCDHRGVPVRVVRPAPDLAGDPGTAAALRTGKPPPVAVATSRLAWLAGAGVAVGLVAMVFALR